MRLSNALLCILSLLLSLVLYLHVQSQAEPSVQRELSVSLERRNLSSNLVQIQGPDHVTVIAEGSTEDLRKVRSEDISAYIDLTNATAGRRLIEVKLSAPTRASVKFSLRNPTERFEFAKVERIARDIEIQTRGTLPPGLVYDGSIAQPATVTIAGPADALQRVDKVRAFLDLSKIKRTGDTYTSQVFVLDDRSRPIIPIRTDPETVTILPSVAVAPESKSVLITPTWKGQPAFGFEVRQYELKPNQIEVTGESSILASLRKIETEPIDLTGLKADAMILAQLKLPAGIRTTQPQRIKVTITIAPIPTSPNSGANP